MVKNDNSLKTSVLARHRVRHGIEQLILAGQRQPGERLAQQDLAKQFGVAQSVVRESLLELQFTGLVHSVDNLGMFVSSLDAPKLLAAYEVREMFEGLAARLCCEHASRSDLAKLRNLAKQTHELGQAGNTSRMGALDRLFHEYTLRVSGNDMIVHLTENHRVLGMSVQANRDIDAVFNEHQAIVAAIEDNNPDEAERLAREHVCIARSTIAKLIDEQGYEPQWVVDDPNLESTS
jgi:DNA-binding GntR family transcriptional regulator